MPNKFIHPEGILPDVVHGYTSVVVSTGKKMVHCAGQVPMDADLNLVGETLGEQMDQSFKAIGIALAAGGANIVYGGIMLYHSIIDVTERANLAPEEKFFFRHWKILIG